jgi:hypothetical protein
MQITKLKSTAHALPAALVIATVLAVSFIIVPLAIAAIAGGDGRTSKSMGSDYPIEVMRAHTVYKYGADPLPVTGGYGVHGDR